MFGEAIQVLETFERAAQREAVFMIEAINRIPVVTIEGDDE